MSLCPLLTSCRTSVGFAFSTAWVPGFAGSSSESESGSSRRFWACSSMALRGQRARAEQERWLCPAAMRSSTAGCAACCTRSLLLELGSRTHAGFKPPPSSAQRLWHAA